MTEENKHLESFAKEPLRDRDFTAAEVRVEAQRCLQCKVPLCRRGCPIGNDIPEFIHALVAGDPVQAATYVYQHSDLPAICGRVCPREKQCEGACVWNHRGRPIAIGKLERFIADQAFAGRYIPRHVSTGQAGKVAVIGSGPAGLSVARNLAMRDYAVTVWEAKDCPGGMLMYGIPTFRLHKDVVLREVKLLEEMGVQFRYGVKIGQQQSPEFFWKEGFAAVFVGIGTAEEWNLGVKNEHCTGVIGATAFLEDVQKVQYGKAEVSSLPVRNGDRVVVIGAGNVAIDAARTAVRLGAVVTIVYRRAEKNMKCLPSEYEEAKEDGVQFQFYSAPCAVVGTDHVQGLQYEKQKILEDATMVPTGEFGIIEADKIIAAIGNKPEEAVITQLQVKTQGGGYIAVQKKPYGMTNYAGVFAAGDIVHKPATVVLAMREGRKVAAGIDAYVRSLQKER